MLRVCDVMLPSCCLWLNFRLRSERTDMPDKEVQGREAKHSTQRRRGGEGERTREKTLQKFKMLSHSQFSLRI